MTQLILCQAIVVNQQSLQLEAKSSTAQFNHYLSLASSSRSETQRRDALAYLTTTLASQPVNCPMPVSTAVILPKLLPTILDGTAAVRKQLLKFFQELPDAEVGNHAETALLYIRAGMTHLAAEIRDDAVATLDWLLGAAGVQVVECAGGWVKTLNAFMSMMGWAVNNEKTKWSSTSKASFGKSGKSVPQQMIVLAHFLQAGLAEDVAILPINIGSSFPVWGIDAHLVSIQRNPFAYLNLFRVPRDEETEMYTDREARQRIFRKLFEASIEKGIDNGLKEAGENGRAAAVLRKSLDQGMSDYDGIDV